MRARTLIGAAWLTWEAGALLRLRQSADIAHGVTDRLDLWLVSLPTWGLVLAIVVMAAIFGAVSLLLAREAYHAARWLYRFTVGRNRAPRS